MSETEIKTIREHVKAISETKDVELARNVNAYINGVMDGYNMAKGKEAENAESKG